MNIEELNELSDVEKWEWVLDNMNLVQLNDTEDVYFTIPDDEGNDDFELTFNEPIEMEDGIVSLFNALGFESHNY